MTDPFDAAAAAGHALQQQLAETTQALAAETAQEQGDETTIAALQKQVADLEAQLNPTPAPQPKPALAWGTNIGTDKGQLTQVDAEMGGIGAARWYSSPGKGIHYPTSADLGGDLGSRILIASYKLNPTDVIAGTHDAAITATAKACPTDKKTLLCLWHEPGKEVYETHEFTAQQYRDAQARFARLVHAVGNPQVMVALIVEGYTWNGKAGRNWHDLYAGPGTADVFCTDEYVFGPTTNLSTLFAGCRAAADEAGVPCSVTETGVDKSTFTGQARYDALTSVARRAKAVSNGPVAMYFGADPGDRWDLCTDPKALAAWRAGQA